MTRRLLKLLLLAASEYNTSNIADNSNFKDIYLIKINSRLITILSTD